MACGSAALATLDSAVRAALAAPAAAGVTGAGAASPGGASPGVAIDLAGLARFDSAALAVLLELGRRHGGRSRANGSAGAVGAAGAAGAANSADAAPADTCFGRTLFLLNPPAKLLDLARLYGLAGLMFGRQE